MAKNSIRDYANIAASNTDVQGQNIDEGCSPATINNAIREVMADLADVNDGTISLVSPDFDAATINSVAIDAFPSGTKMLFQQSSAPTGWAKDTTHNDKALRVVNGTAGTGGSVAFETAFASQTPAGTLSITISDTTLDDTHMPDHFHYLVANTSSTNTGTLTSTNQIRRGGFQELTTHNEEAYNLGGSSTSATIGKSSTVGNTNPESHTHGIDTASFIGSAMNLDVSYVDIIIATKD